MRGPVETETGDLPLYEMIYRVLREHIADASLPKGLVVGEAAVARAFQSSRAPAAAALQRLKEEGLLRSFDGRGFLIGDAIEEPLRLDLIEAGLTLPETDALNPSARNRRVRIYPEVEHVVARPVLDFVSVNIFQEVAVGHYGNAVCGFRRIYVGENDGLRVERAETFSIRNTQRGPQK